MAEHVMRMSAPEAERREAGAEGTSQTRAIPGRTPDGTSPAARLQALQEGGQSLPASARAFFEPRFGADFSRVRVHADSRAAQAAQAVQAHAFTVGRDLVFNTGQYAPGTARGRGLLAHELAHVVQQRSRPPMIQRVSYGKDGELSPELKAIVQGAADIVERRITTRDFEAQWNSFWMRFGKLITPQPTLEAYRAAVKGRVVHDMDGSTSEEVKKFLKEEAGFPLERQTAAVTRVGSTDTYMRRFAIRQGVDSVASLLLHESWHGAGLGMGPLESYEPAFHEFEAAVGYPIMMGGGKIESVKQTRRGDTGVDVTIAYSLHRIGKDPLPSKVELQIAAGDSATVVFRQSLPSRAGRNVVTWKAENPGWVSHSVRLRNMDEDSVMAAERIETHPRCVLGVSTMHCEGD